MPSIGIGIVKTTAQVLVLVLLLGNRHTRGSAKTTNARGWSTRGLTSEPVPSAIKTAPQMRKRNWYMFLCSTQGLNMASKCSRKRHFLKYFQRGFQKYGNLSLWDQNFGAKYFFRNPHLMLFYAFREFFLRKSLKKAKMWSFSALTNIT